MTTYRVYLRSDIYWTVRPFKARSPRQAIQLARRFADKHFDQLDLSGYEPIDCPINEIEVLDEHGNQLAEWQDSDLRLRFAPAICSKRLKWLSPVGNEVTWPRLSANSIPPSQRRKAVLHKHDKA